MKKTAKIIIFVFGVLSLTACSWFDDDAIKPVPLMNFTQTLAVHKIWVNGNSTGSANQYLELTPAIAGDRAYTVSYLGKVRAVDVNNGSTIWKVKTNVHLTSGISFDDGLLFVSDSHGQILALSQVDGSIKWRKNIASEVLTKPVVAQGKVIIKSEDQLIALDEKSGAKIWNHRHDEPSLVLRGSSTPKVIGDIVVCGFANGNLVAFDIDAGRPIWQQALADQTGSSIIERMIDVDADMAVFDNVIYASSYQGNIVAVNLQGQVLWKRALSSYTGVIATMTNVYVSDAGNDRIQVLEIKY